MPQIPPDILRLARNHHRQLLALDKKARRAVERQLSLALEEVTAELDRLDPERFRAQQLRIVAFLADLTQRLTSQKLEAVLEASIREMYRLAPGHTVDEINEWMAYYGYEARPLNLAAIAEAAETSIIQQVPASLARWGPGIERRVRSEVAMMLTTRGDRAAATAAVQRAIDGERWVARRIVRTETMGAYNRAHNASLMKARDEEGVDDLKKSAIVTFDARTDQDSYPLDGQVRELEELFEDGNGRRYLHPPGRPNDREKEIPWLEPPEALPRSSGGGTPPRGETDEVGLDEYDGTTWPKNQPELGLAGLEPTVLDEEVEGWGTHIGAAGRPYYYDEISLPLERRTLRGVEITREGIESVRRHLSRFDELDWNTKMVKRLEDILAGNLKLSEFDVRFYSHELRELERYTAAGYPTGVPESDDERSRLWNNEHTATLEEYGFDERVQELHHPDVK